MISRERLNVSQRCSRERLFSCGADGRVLLFFAVLLDFAVLLGFVVALLRLAELPLDVVDFAADFPAELVFFAGLDLPVGDLLLVFLGDLEEDDFFAMVVGEDYSTYRLIIGL